LFFYQAGDTCPSQYTKVVIVCKAIYVLQYNQIVCAATFSYVFRNIGTGKYQASGKVTRARAETAGKGPGDEQEREEGERVDVSRIGPELVIIKP
jgi:hypothetical protein